MFYFNKLQEEGEYMRGKMLSYGAVVRSGQATVEQLGIVVDKLLLLSSKRSYLSLPAHTFIAEAFNQVPLSPSHESKLIEEG